MRPNLYSAVGTEMTHTPQYHCTLLTYNAISPEANITAVISQHDTMHACAHIHLTTSALSPGSMYTKTHSESTNVGKSYRSPAVRTA